MENQMKTKDILIIALVMIVAVTLLIAMGKDASILIAFLMAAIVPTIAVNRIGKGVEEARDNSEQTLHNTNGRMTELIDVNRDLITHLESAGVNIDPETLEKHQNYLPEHSDNNVDLV